MENITLLKCVNPALTIPRPAVGRDRRDEGNTADVMLDIAVADDLKATFYADSFTNSIDLLREVVANPFTIYGTSDGARTRSSSPRVATPPRPSCDSSARTTSSSSKKRTIDSACSRRTSPACATEGFSPSATSPM